MTYILSYFKTLHAQLQSQHPQGLLQVPSQAPSQEPQELLRPLTRSLTRRLLTSLTRFFIRHAHKPIFATSTNHQPPAMPLMPKKLVIYVTLVIVSMIMQSMLVTAVTIYVDEGAPCGKFGLLTIDCKSGLSCATDIESESQSCVKVSNQ